MITTSIFLGLVLLIAVPYWLRAHRHHRSAAQAGKSVQALNEPVTLHPRIDLLTCIGCGSCVQICPEHVLSLVGGHAAITNGSHCVGHALCEAACPVSAITMVFGTPREGMEIPYYNEEHETNIPGLFIAGELGGIGLIRNAIRQGTTAIDIVAERARPNGCADVLIVGAGPAGVAAALDAQSKQLRYLVLEQDALGGSILHYPRKKLVLTQPVDLPLYGRIKGPEISKEDLLALFHDVRSRFGIEVKESHKVESIRKLDDRFLVSTKDSAFEAHNVILAMGRRGTPNKLGVPGEDLPKVLYKLIEAEQYRGKHVLIVGGGDSAIEAAVALASQEGNTVTLSYRRTEFVRLKEKNQQKISQLMAQKAVRVLFGSSVNSISEEEVRLTDAGQRTINLQNDAVFIFAGGVLPAAFLKQCGIRMREAA